VYDGVVVEESTIVIIELPKLVTIPLLSVADTTHSIVSEPSVVKSFLALKKTKT